MIFRINYIIHTFKRNLYKSKKPYASRVVSLMGLTVYDHKSKQQGIVLTGMNGMRTYEFSSKSHLP
jgi:hypothetical protein